MAKERADPVRLLAELVDIDGVNPGLALDGIVGCACHGAERLAT